MALVKGQNQKSRGVKGYVAGGMGGLPKTTRDLQSQSAELTFNRFHLHAEAHTALCAATRGIAREHLSEAVTKLQWHLRELQADYQRLWSWLAVSCPDYVARNAEVGRVHDALTQVLGAIRVQLVFLGWVVHLNATQCIPAMCRACLLPFCAKWAEQLDRI